MSFLDKFKNNSKSKGQRFSLSKWLKGNVKGDDGVATYDGVGEEQKAEEQEKEDPVANYRKIEVRGLKRSLHVPASFLTTESELNMMAPMKVSTKDVNRNGWIILFGMIAGLVFPMFIPQLGSVASKFGVGILLMIGVWFINYYNIKSHFANFSFKNQLRFNTLLTVLDLSELKRGYSINALLSKTSARFEDETLSEAIATLNSRIQDKPDSPEPYLVFAREFSTTRRARLFMMSVYRMAQGNYDDSEIKSLKHSAAKDLSDQSVKLAKHKTGKFNKLQLMEFTGFILYLVTYILFFVGLHVFQILKGAM